MDESIKNEQNIQVQIYATGDNESESYAAIFKDEDNVYYCNGSLPYKDIKEILKYMIIIK